MAGALSGDVLPPQVIYKGKQTRATESTTFLMTGTLHIQKIIGQTKTQVFATWTNSLYRTLIK